MYKPTFSSSTVTVSESSTPKETINTHLIILSINKLGISTLGRLILMFDIYNKMSTII